MAPIVAVNLPNVDDHGERQLGAKPGTVGHPIPGVAAKVVDPDTGEGPLFGKEGLLLVSGPNRMAGYLGDPERTREVTNGDWYVTGDIAVIDESGFIRITDRLSRFSKIAGEMVPHMKLEDSVTALLEEHHTSAVTSIPDPARGERLVVFFTDPQKEPQDLWEGLCHTDLPRLWLPKREDLHFIESLPTLGSGKVDLRAVRQMAMDRMKPVAAGS
jgi:acyl-[acyl-carrier-protein]-phospholipid O-acyltransferase/long-chain-fatty-acid--[acyl-carrier-protein] ligase